MFIFFISTFNLFAINVFGINTYKGHAVFFHSFCITVNVFFYAENNGIIIELCGRIWF